MSATSKIALGVAGGYLLGRTKKLRLAITLGSMLAGQKIATDRAGMVKQIGGLIEGNPELSKIRDQIMGQLMQSARAAAMTTATSRLQQLTTQLEGGSSRSDDDEDDEYDEQDEDSYADDEDQYDEDEGAEDEGA